MILHVAGTAAIGSLRFAAGARFLGLWISLAGAVPAVASASNFLVIIADDLGVDAVSTYDEHVVAAPTPNLDALAADGVLFRSAWANPACTPSRASLLTGLFARTTGVGANASISGGLDPDTTTIADLAQAAGHTTFAVGKWHLTPDPLPMTAPLEMGFDHHSGSRATLIDGYSMWEKFVDGVSIPNYGVYATTDTTDDALAFIAAAPGPWFGYVAYNAPHAPFHAPPAHLHSYDLAATTPQSDPATHYRAAVEAMDSEIGRLLASIPPADLAQTVVLFVGDNGTPSAATLPPFDPDRAKLTSYEGGVHVPLIVAGAAVGAAQKDRESDAIVHIADLFATIQELGSFATAYRASDSVSLAPYLANASLGSIRRWRAAGRFTGAPGSSARLAVSNDCYKLLQMVGVEFYDLCSDPFETNNLLLGTLSAEQQANFDLLSPYLVSTPQCDNGIDDDGDGGLDFAGAPGAGPDVECAGIAVHDSELLPEPAGSGAAALATLAWLVRRRRARSSPNCPDN